MRRGSGAEMSEGKIMKRIAATGVRLRCDRVAVRLLDDVKAAIGQILAEDQTIAFTVTAPIKRPSKTTVALQEHLRHLRIEALSTTINGNALCARIVNHTSCYMPRVIGFVHNPDINASFLLEIAETSLRER